MMFVNYLCISFVSLLRERGIVGRAPSTFIDLEVRGCHGESAARADRPQRPPRVVEPLAEKEWPGLDIETEIATIDLLHSGRIMRLEVPGPARPDLPDHLRR